MKFPGKLGEKYSQVSQEIQILSKENWQRLEAPAAFFLTQEDGGDFEDDLTTTMGTDVNLGARPASWASGREHLSDLAP